MTDAFDARPQAGTIKSIQKFASAFTAAGATVTISPVNTAKTIIYSTGGPQSPGSGSVYTFGVYLSSKTTVTVDPGSATAGQNGTAYFQVVEYN